MKVIGFANKFYTLWDVREETSYTTAPNGNSYPTRIDTIFTYYQNLSMTLEGAKAKYPELEVDENLKGTSTFRVRGEFIPMPEDDNYFSNYNCAGKLIEGCTNVYWLKRGMKEERSARRKVNCRMELIKLGELVRYKNEERRIKNITEYKNEYEYYNCINDNIKLVSVNYATPAQVEKLEVEKLEKSLSGHFFIDGSKVKLSIKLIKIFGFDSAYGFTTVAKYLTSCGKVVSYMGSNPLDISAEDFVDVTATIKHDNYKGENTKLIRIKKVILKTA